MCNAEACTTPPLPPTTIQPKATGAKAVTVQLCPACDYLRCQHCRRPVLDRSATRCPSCKRTLA